MSEHKGGTDYNWIERSRTRRTHEVPFSVGCIHFTRKNTRFRAPVFSQNEAHATSTHPLQCVLQHYVANPNLFAHMATQHGNIHATIPLRSPSPLLQRIVRWCKPSHHHSLQSIVMWSKVSHHLSLQAILMWSKGWHHPSLQSIVLWCKVSHHPWSSALHIPHHPWSSALHIYCKWHTTLHC